MVGLDVASAQCRSSSQKDEEAVSDYKVALHMNE